MLGLLTISRDILFYKISDVLESFSHKQDDDADGQEEGVLEDEAELLLDYIEKFNDLFENKKYVEAAYYAAASPRNILRNAETLFRFKGKYNITIFG